MCLPTCIPSFLCPATINPKPTTQPAACSWCTQKTLDLLCIPPTCARSHASHHCYLLAQLVYPDAKVRHPDFVRQSDRDKLFSRSHIRHMRGAQYDYYANRMGRNFVFGNATYDGRPRAGFVKEACMGNG